MSRYLPRASRAVPFDGDIVNVSVDRISMKDAMSHDSGKGAAEMMERTEALLRGHNAKFDGLKDGDGNVVTTDQVFSTFYFSPLVNAAADLLMSTGEVAKESAAPLGANST